ncbi:caspase family protein [Nocardia asteroides]
MATGRRSALIVACDNYQDPGLRKLKAPTRDAAALAGVLRDPRIGGFDVRVSVNEPAYVISEGVEEFFDDRGADDLLLLHFSCHGVKDEGGDLYFAAANTKLRRLGATGVAADFVNRRMNRSRSRRIVLLLDCCYAGAFERGMTHRAGTGMNLEEQLSGRGRAVITASSAMEYSFESGELADRADSGPSVFTGALVEGLATGKADRNQDGLITLDELYDYVYAEVRANSPNQTPGKWVFGVQGDLYIARRDQRLSEPTPLPVELGQLIDSPLSSVRAVAVRELEKLLHGRHLGLAEAAQQALRKLADDDSRSVSAAAVAALAIEIPRPALPPAADQPRPSQPAADGGPPRPSPPMPGSDRPIRTAAPHRPHPRPQPKPRMTSPAATPRTPRPPARAQPFTPATTPRRNDPVLLRRVSGAMMVAAAVLMACNPFVPYYAGSARTLIENGPEVALPALVMAALVGSAGIVLLGAHAARYIGTGLALGQSATWPWFISNQWDPRSDWGVATWLWFVALLLLVLAAGSTLWAVIQMEDVRLEFRLPTDGRSWTSVCLSAVILAGLACVEIAVAKSPTASPSATVFSWSAMALVVPVCATATVPRRFGSALLLGWCGPTGLAMYYSAYTAIDEHTYPEVVIVFATISSLVFVALAFMGVSGVRGKDNRT